ncbi:MAG: hypothetical protein QXZ22_02370 [Sulfolobales archaeon]
MSNQINSVLWDSANVSEIRMPFSPKTLGGVIDIEWGRDNLGCESCW